MGQMLVEREAALREVLEWEAGLQALHAHIALRFSRSESRQRVLAYLQWSAWQLTLGTLDGVQRLLAGSGRPARVVEHFSRRGAGSG